MIGMIPPTPTSVQLPGRDAVHVGYPYDAVYRPACIPADRVTASTAEPVDKHVTCRNCYKTHPADAAYLNANQSVSRTLAPVHYRPAKTAQIGLAARQLHRYVAELGYGMLDDDRNRGFGHLLRCGEADALAGAFIAVGFAQAAIDLIATHAGEDADFDDDHWVEDRNDDDQRYAFAEGHVVAMAMSMELPEMVSTIVTRQSRKRRISVVRCSTCHGPITASAAGPYLCWVCGRLVEGGPDGMLQPRSNWQVVHGWLAEIEETPATGQPKPVWTVAITTTARIDGEAPFLYVLYAADATTAKVTALAAHLAAQHVDGDPDPFEIYPADGLPRHHVRDVHPGDDQPGSSNDLRPQQIAQTHVGRHTL